MGRPLQTLEADAAPFKASLAHRMHIKAAQLIARTRGKLCKAVVTAELGDSFAAHVALQNGRLGFSQVDQHQSVEYIGEFSIYVEAQEFAADLRVLPEKDRKAFAVALNIGDGLGEFVKIAQGFTGGAAVPRA